MPSRSTPDERRAFVLNTLSRVGRLTTMELSARFSISEDSARRDFRELSAEGLIQRVHGAALPLSPATMPFAARYKIASGTKERLAKKAATYIKPGQTVLFDGGTTNFTIAKQIPPALSCTAITNSPPIALALADHPHIKTIIVGGTFDKHSQMTLGASVLEAMQRINADICFFGVHSIDAKAGLTTVDIDEATIKSAMIKAATETIAVATSDKIGTTAAHKIAAVNELDKLVTNATKNSLQLNAISQSGTVIDIV